MNEKFSIFDFLTVFIVLTDKDYKNLLTSFGVNCLKIADFRSKTGFVNI